jgi:hypothetical protein
MVFIYSMDYMTHFDTLATPKMPQAITPKA